MEGQGRRQKHKASGQSSCRAPRAACCLLPGPAAASCRPPPPPASRPPSGPRRWLCGPPLGLEEEEAAVRTVAYIMVPRSSTRQTTSASRRSDASTRTCVLRPNATP